MSESPRMCPVARYDRAEEGYAERVATWIADPHAYFTAFGPEARAFQKRHRSERLRTMTLVIAGEELAKMRPCLVSLDGQEVVAKTWEQVFATTLFRLMAAYPETFAALEAAGELQWLGPLGADGYEPGFSSWGEVVSRVQWLFLMCGIRLNEVVVQVDPYTNEAWAVRKREIDERRAADKAFLEGRRAAQKAWAADHPEETRGGSIFL